MSSTNFDDLGILARLLFESLEESLERRDELANELNADSNVHGSREGIVGGLTLVNVVVGVNWLFGAEFVSKDLVTTVGDDFVDVHIGLSSRTSLPDDEREVLVERTRKNLVANFGDRLGHLGLQTKVKVGQSSGLLHESHSVDHWDRHALTTVTTTNLKVLKRSFDVFGEKMRRQG